MNETATQISEVDEGVTSGETSGGEVAEAANGLDVQATDVGSDWRNGLDPSVRSALDVDSIADLAKGYVSAQQMIGNSIRIPSKEAGEADWNKFYDRFKDVPGLTRYDPNDLSSLYEAAGRPKDISGYQMPDEDKGFLEAAHAAGLNRAQLGSLLEYVQDQTLAAEAESKQQMDATVAGLKKDWGLAFEEKLEQSQNAVKYLEESIPGLGDALDRTGAGDDPAIIKLFQVLGSNLSETDGFGSSSAASASMTPHEAKAQILEIQNNPQHPYNQGDEDAIAAFIDLHRYAYPNAG